MTARDRSHVVDRTFGKDVRFVFYALGGVSGQVVSENGRFSTVSQSRRKVRFALYGNLPHY